MPQKTFIPLENNPTVMTSLAHTLGLSPNLAFHDLYSLHDRTLLSLIPNPLALLFVYPETSTSKSFITAREAAEPAYISSGPGEPVMWYRQTIEHACGLIGLLHCTTNGEAGKHISPGSALARLIEEATPLAPDERAQLLSDSDILEKAHGEAAQTGDTVAPPLGEEPGHAFIAFVKGKDGYLWEMAGFRNGPVSLGKLGDDEDVLSEKALSLGPLPYIAREAAGTGNMNFSCTVLAPV